MYIETVRAIMWKSGEGLISANPRIAGAVAKAALNAGHAVLGRIEKSDDPIAELEWLGEQWQAAQELRLQAFVTGARLSIAAQILRDGKDADPALYRNLAGLTGEDEAAHEIFRCARAIVGLEQVYRQAYEKTDLPPMDGDRLAGPVMLAGILARAASDFMEDATAASDRLKKLAALRAECATTAASRDDADALEIADRWFLANEDAIAILREDAEAKAAQPREAFSYTAETGKSVLDASGDAYKSARAAWAARQPGSPEHLSDAIRAACKTHVAARKKAAVIRKARAEDAARKIERAQTREVLRDIWGKAR